MSRITRILIATDFSPHSAAAMRTASELSGRLGVPLIIYNTIQIPTYPLPEGVATRSPEVISELLTRAQQALDDQRHAAVMLGAQYAALRASPEPGSRGAPPANAPAGQSDSTTRWRPMRSCMTSLAPP